MASHNSFPGYVKLPSTELYHHEIRVDFNCHVNSAPSATKLEGFSLRLFHLGEDHPEISVTVSAEQWLDLIDAMRVEFEQAQQIRKKFEGLQGGTED